MSYFLLGLFLVCLAVDEIQLCRKSGNILDCSRQNYNHVPYSVIDNHSDGISEVDLTYNNIKTITPSNFKTFYNFKKLSLSHNHITLENLEPDSFKRFTGLRELYLDFNNISAIPQLPYLSHLRRLVLDGNKINNLPPNCFKKLRRLKYLRLSNNNIHTIDYNAFRGLENKLDKLFLHGNELKLVPSRAIKRLKKLSFLDISKNKITHLEDDTFRDMFSLKNIKIFDERNTLKIEDQEKDIAVSLSTFRHMRSLDELKLHYYNVKINAFPNLDGTHNIRRISVANIKKLTIPEEFCHKNKQLLSISVGYCSLERFPALSKCESLNTIDFVLNNITHIPKNSFSGLKNIENLEIIQQQNEIDCIDRDAFSNLPSLVELDLSHFRITEFPNLNGTHKLRKLSLRHCSIKKIPSHICKNLQELRHFDLAMNDIKYLPDFSMCNNLKDIDLYGNRIQTIGEQFKKLKKLEHVSLSENHISQLSETAFNSSFLTSLLLDRNMLRGIQENTFKHTKNLRTLNLSYNDLTHFPRKYLESIYEINVVGNKKLETFPTQEEMPHARRLTLVYNYHCCFFMKKVQQINHEVSASILTSNSKWKKYNNGKNLSNRFYVNTNDNAVGIDNIEPHLRWLNNGTKLYFNKPEEGENRNYNAIKNFDVDAFCVPSPNEFYPCEDLMGKQWLRVCVWVVFLLAVFGNITVLVVLIVNCGKLDVPRYLIINLAFADLCLGIYLGFLALVDLMTLGDFRSHALQWQFSSSCQIAGFLAVFASELSVYTLTAITIERFTTIKNSMHVERRMSKNQSAIVMSVGWLFSACVAALPLNLFSETKFSDYSKYSVCLPFEQDELSSKVYLVFLLLFNTLAFVIILACYVKIYLFIRGSNAWNSSDTRVARRMAILVATDFLCWFPISVTAMSAVFGSSILSDLWMSKVLTVFIFPLNACANPFLYAILTKQFRKDIASLVRNIRETLIRRKTIRKSLLKLPIKESLTYSTSVRRGSSCSFLFNRRCSSKPDDVKMTSRSMTMFRQHEDIHDEDFQDECNEMLTSV